MELLFGCTSSSNLVGAHVSMECGLVRMCFHALLCPCVYHAVSGKHYSSQSPHHSDGANHALHWPSVMSVVAQWCACSSSISINRMRAERVGVHTRCSVLRCIPALPIVWLLIFANYARRRRT